MLGLLLSTVASAFFLVFIFWLGGVYFCFNVAF